MRPPTGDPPAAEPAPHPAPHHLPLTGLAAIGAAALLTACGASVASSSSSGSAGAATVKVATVSVSGTSEQVLTTAGGLTLYYFTPDSSTSVTCTGSCAGVWPPLLLPSGQPAASTSLPRGLSVVSGANGRQVEYDGHPLYTYSGDSGPGQANGEGVQGTWYVATPSLGGAEGAPTASPSSAPTPPVGY